MAKHLNVELNFSANTRQAQQQLKSLQSQMDALFTNMGKSELPVTKGLVKAQSAAASLQVALNQAINQDTGKLDLLKFTDSINKAGLDINQLSKHLNKLGPDGQKAFMTLTQSIIDAEVPAKRTSALLNEMWTTLKNTARWQISSSIMHGFQSTLQSAMGYAQDLDKSLNNIRIVTGQNVDQMAKFAENANKAAKALSTTTTKYTDAALIYYQQGLTDEEVLERTNVTVKMANVAGQTAEVVSDQMTAVWNNFYDGSKTLEYYADVMTALGAATASSTDEISTGLNKFAAVSNTVGLSYEYAASALATVTATTRQSADIVGTAFRTLFTRIQGLSLGETLDDGVTLNKYSEALNAVGVNIMDQYGQLKDMDVILDELGSKWENISKEQQVGLAQTIGGARQYATLIALMDNWEFFQENLSTSIGAEGELEKQADIYAESWEAAQKRTKTALQGIYDSLLDEDLFIGVADSLTTIYTGIEKIIDSAGGMTGVLLLLGTTLTKVFGTQLQKNIENLGYRILSFAGINEQAANNIRQQAYNKAISMSADTGTFTGDAEINILKNQTKLKQELYNLSNKITDEEKEKIGYLIEINKQYGELVIKAAQARDNASDALGNASLNIKKSIVSKSEPKNKDLNVEIFKTNREVAEDTIKTAVKSYKDLDYLKNSNFNNFSDNNFDTQIKTIIDNFNKNSFDSDRLKVEDALNKYNNAITNGDKNARNNLIKTLSEVITKENALTKAMVESEDQIKGNADNVTKYAGSISFTKEQIEQFIQNLVDAAECSEDYDRSQESMSEHAKLVNKAMQEATANVANYSQVIVNSFQGITQLLFGLNSLKTAVDTLNNDDLTFFEKLTNISMTLSMGLPALINAYNSFVTATATLNALKEKENALTAKGIIDSLMLKMVKEANLLVDDEDLKLKTTNILLTKLLNIETGKLVINYGLLAVYIGAAVAAIALLIYAFNKIKENSPEAKIKKANEELDRMKSVMAEVNNETENLINTLNGFDSAYDKIQNMTKGTLEWYTAMNKLHEEVKGLLEEYDLNINEDILVEDGYYVGLTASGREKVENQQKERFENTQAATRATEIASNKVKADEYKNLLENTLVTETSNKLNNISDGGGIHATQLREINADAILEEMRLGKSYEQAIENSNLGHLAENFLLENEKIKNSFNEAADAARNYTRSLEDTAYTQTLLSENQYYDPQDKTWKSSFELDKNLTKEDISAIPKAISLLEESWKEDIKKDLNLNYNKDSAQVEEYYKAKGYIYDEEKDKWYTDQEKKNEVKLNQEDMANYFAQKAVNNILENLFNEENKTYYNQAIGKAKEIAPEQSQYSPNILNNNENTQKQNIITGFSEEERKDYNASMQYLYDELLDKNQKYRDAVQSGNDEIIRKILASTKEMAERVSAANIAMNKGFANILDNYKEYYKVLQDINNPEYAQYLSELRTDFGQLFDITDTSLLTEEFLTAIETLDLMKAAAEGNFDAIEELSRLTAISILENMGLLTEELKSIIMGFDFGEYEYDVELDLTSNLATELQTMLETSEDGVKAVEEILNSMSFEPQITWAEADMQALDFSSKTYYDENGNAVSETEFHEGASAKLYVPVLNAVYRGGQKSINIDNRSKASSNGSSARSKQKKASDEIDRYHEIKEVIEDLEREMDRLGKAKDRAWGKSKLNLIDQEIGKVEEAIAAQKEYLDQISANIGPDQTAIAAYGATFDEMGRITNYEELIQSQINKYNSMVASGDEDAAEEQYEKFKKALEQYEETADLYEDEWEKLVDLQNEFYDKLLEKVEYTVELNIEISDTKLKYLDYLIERLGDDAYRTSEEITALFGNLTEQTEQAFKRINTYQKGIEAIFANHGANAQDWLSGKMSNEQLVALGFTEAEIEALIKYQEGLIEENKSLIEIKDNIINQITESFNGFNEEMQRGIDKISHLKNVMNSFKNIVGLVGKQKLGISDETIANMNNALVNMSIDKLASSRTRAESLKAAMDELQTRINAETNEEIKADMQKTFDEMQKEYEAATEDMLGTWEETLQQINDVFNEAVDTALANFERRMAAGYGSLDALLTASDRAKTIDEQYLSDYRQIYELSKLTRDINNSIDNTDNLQGKRELKELLNEINEIQNQGVQMSAYDLEYLQKKYDLRLAEIALEDAQNAKNQVRMTRDADGNWSYTYTADESAVGGAAQNYEDKLYALQEISNNYLNQISEQWIQSEKEWSEALASIYQDAMLSEEERQLQIDETNLFYQERFAYFTSEIEKATGNNKVLYEEDWRAYLDKTEQQIASNEDFQTSFNDTVLGTLYDGFDTVKDLQSELNAAIGGPGENGTLLGDLSIAYADWSARVDEAMDTAGIATEDFDKTMNEVADNTEAASEQMARSVENSANDMSDAFGTLLDNVDSWLDAYRDKIEIAIKENELLAESVIELMAILGAESSSKSMNSKRAGGSGGGGSTGGNGGDENPGSTGNPTKTKTVYYFRDFPYKDTKGEVANQIREWCEKAYGVPNTGTHNGFYEQFYAEIKTKSVPFKTGGYTGEWGSEGRLAMLHEKELVLHEGDTENFLSAVNMIREITRIIDLNTLGSLMGLGVLKEAQSITDSNQIIEQEVTIHAEFPNATNHNEIEEAFNNLINTASQYANRKKI